KAAVDAAQKAIAKRTAFETLLFNIKFSLRCYYIFYLTKQANISIKTCLLFNILSLIYAQVQHPIYT
ncbi:hypothetical protein, partial [Pseudoalteromonas sp. S1688]|uniref:hypothetical protein n=1 Tax=Pseudoalteromonas sp. S1688 TaxID=579511 RepID=UPI00127060B7